MGEAIGGVIPLGIAVAFSPLPIIGVVLILATPSGRANALAFAFAALVAVSAIGGVAIVVMNAIGAEDPAGEGDPGTWVSIGRLVLGALLLRFALRQWRARPQPGAPDPEPPGWMRTVDTLSAPRAAGLGVLLCGVNPKNLILILAAAATIAQTGASTEDQAAALAVFVVLAMLGVALPIGASLLLGSRAARFLDELREWMVRENTTIIAVIAVLIAAKLIGDAVAGLAG